jgi:hypothetical protein
MFGSDDSATVDLRTAQRRAHGMAPGWSSLGMVPGYAAWHYVEASAVDCNPAETYANIGSFHIAAGECEPAEAAAQGIAEQIAR